MIIAARPWHGAPLLLALVLLGSCASGVPEPRLPVTSSSAPDTGVRSYRPGDCLALTGDTARKVGCEVPHEAEVMSTGELPATSPAPVEFVAGPACEAALPGYLGSPDATASRLEARLYRQTTENISFACLVVERGPDIKPVRRTGSLAGALSGGLGVFQQCLVGEPFAEPLQVVPCDQPHRSEAVPGVLKLGSPNEPMPSAKDIFTRAITHCDGAIGTYLGGTRPGVQPSGRFPQANEWPTGKTTAVCYAISDTPVTGSLR
jgi:hypothetical protein